MNLIVHSAVPEPKSALDLAFLAVTLKTKSIRFPRAITELLIQAINGGIYNSSYLLSFKRKIRMCFIGKTKKNNFKLKFYFQ